MRKFTKTSKISYQKAPDIKKRVNALIDRCGFETIVKNSIYCLRSENAKSRAVARIWGLSRVWQDTLGVPPSYIIEVISERFDKLSDNKQDQVLIHELMHIPVNFSGALVPHYRKGKRNFYKKVRDKIKYLK